MRHSPHSQKRDHHGEEARQVANTPDVADIGVGAGPVTVPPKSFRIRAMA